MTDPMPTILDTLAGAVALHSQELGTAHANKLRERGTGDFGNVRLDWLPTGWVNITIFRKDRSVIDGDTSTDYYGPILRRTDTFIVIDVAGAPLVFEFAHALVTEGTA